MSDEKRGFGQGQRLAHPAISRLLNRETSCEQEMIGKEQNGK
jgi:hypothetical protein